MKNNLFYKIHWILGLLAGAILLVVGVTGAILSFEKEILRVLNPTIYSIKSDGKQLDVYELIEKYKEQNSNAKINNITLNANESYATIINIASSDPSARRGVNTYVNPYTGEILPSEITGQEFFKVVQDLHRRLMMGDIGKQIVGASVLIFILILISGTYLHLKMMRKGFLNSLTFSFSSKGRMFLYSMHSAIGMWMVPFLLFVSLTGLYWSYDWYRAGLHSIAGVPMPQQRQAQATQPQENTQQQSLGEQIGQRGQKNKEETIEENTSIVTQSIQSPNRQNRKIRPEQFSASLELFKQNIPNGYDRVSFKIPEVGAFITFNYFDANEGNARARNSIQVNFRTLEIGEHTRFEDNPIGTKLIRSMLPLHSGEYFGMVGRILMFLASLSVALFSITGLMLFIQRHKKSKR